MQNFLEGDRSIKLLQNCPCNSTLLDGLENAIVNSTCPTWKGSLIHDSWFIPIESEAQPLSIPLYFHSLVLLCGICRIIYFIHSHILSQNEIPVKSYSKILCSKVCSTFERNSKTSSWWRINRSFFFDGCTSFHCCSRYYRRRPQWLVRRTSATNRWFAVRWAAYSRKSFLCRLSR